MAVQAPRRRFTVDEYYQMARAGILSEDDRVELIDGEIFEMPPIGPRHSLRVAYLTELFVGVFQGVAMVWVQNPIRLGKHSEPQPDLALVRRPPGRYATRHPTPRDIFLVVEVADTSAGYDRHTKIPLYAAAGIPEVWLLDLNDDALVAYRDPTLDGYRSVRVLHRGERLAPIAFSGRELAVEDLLG